MGAAPSPQKLVTKQQYDAALKSYTDTDFSREGAGRDGWYKGDAASRLQAFKDTMSVLPPPAPDLADDAVQKARQAARRKLLMGGMTGPIDLSGGSTAKPLPGLGGT